MTEHQDPASLDPAEVVMCVAFEGWNDAGGAASAAVDHLAATWDMREYAALDPEEYHDFQVNRPTIARLPSSDRVISWPGTVVLTPPDDASQDRRVVVVQGIEPSMRWRAFSREILDHARHLNVTTLVTCGALLVDVPHTRPLPVFTTSEDRDLRERLDLERSEYEGPTGILGVLGHEAMTRGISVLSTWVGVPHYVAHPPSPKATLALLTSLERLLGVAIDLGDLPDEAEAWQRGVDALAADDSDVADHVRHLEETMDLSDSPEASGDAIAAEFERFLRRRDHRGQK